MNAALTFIFSAAFLATCGIVLGFAASFGAIHIFRGIGGLFMGLAKAGLSARRFMVAGAPVSISKAARMNLAAQLKRI